MTLWLGEKTAGSADKISCCRVGEVACGGARPMIVTEGEAGEGRIFGLGTIYVPKAGDEVLVIDTAEGQHVVLGAAGLTLSETEEKGSVVITNGGDGVIRIKSNGTVEISGNVDITGNLTINGETYSPPS